MADTLTIAENERRFIAQELHDNIAQTLLQINMQVGICKRYLELGLQDEVAPELDALETQIQTASQQLRRLIADLRPPVSDDGSLDSALQKLIDTHHQRGGPPVTVNTPLRIPLNGEKRLAFLRIIQELLLNIRKHAQATSVDLTVEIGINRLQLTIIDNGIGFDDGLVPNPLAEKGGAGMINIDIRSTAIGGTFSIKSYPNRGTLAEVTIPL